MEKTTTIPRPEYPRPQFRRRDWLCLNGTWDFAFDDSRAGEKERWWEAFPEGTAITVPFAFQSRNSGIGDTSFHDVVWYRRSIEIPEEWRGRRILLHFGAVDYRARVYVNGRLVCSHEGGHTPFHSDITDALRGEGPDEIVVRAEDPSADETVPRGKQYWKEKSESIFYTRTSGIWQTVWLEPVNERHLKCVRFTPDLDAGDIDVEWELSGADRAVPEGLEIETVVRFGEQTVVADRMAVTEGYLKRSYHLRGRMEGRSNIHGHGWYWHPNRPNLFDVTFVLRQDGVEIDRADSYFGMRKVSVENGRVLLNNRPFTMKLVLDQGYFPDGVLTAPSDGDLRNDIELAKAMGFNGARKHQKVEDPRYLYWADRLGFVVWGEMANCVEYSEDAVSRLTREWIEAVQRDYNAPSVIVWVPINESWGVSRIARESRQQAHATAMYYLTKSLDRTRLVVSNDGWEHTVSDLCTIHNYRGGEELERAYASVDSAVATEPANRPIYADGFAYRGEPILITEYGGVAYQADAAEGWGYATVKDSGQLIEAYRRVTEPLLRSPAVQGYCYTQLTDVEQEINGLLTYDRQLKCDLSEIKRINDGSGRSGS